MTKFIENALSLETSWRSIVLLGSNVASYKFSLAKTLLGIESDKTSISLDEMSLPFAKNICSHLKENPQQITSRSSTFLDYCKKFNEGKVAKLMDFGAFVNILPGKDGLVHISQICEERVENVSDKLSEGEFVKVRVLEIDRQGRVRLSMKAVNEAEIKEA